MKCKKCRTEMYVSFEDSFIGHYDCPNCGSFNCGSFLKKMKVDPLDFGDTESKKEEWIII